VRILDFIVLHTAASYNPKTSKVVHQRVDQIDRYHREHNGWRKIGYHIYVEEDGLIRRGRDDAEIGAHAGGFNQHSLGLCVSGHGDHEAWNDKQLAAVLLQCGVWMGLYPRITVDHVIGHRETTEHGGPVVHKTCPGMLIDMNSIRARLAERLETVA
jgi:N-acetylmuramoyl-L-alanine amidase